MKKILFLDFFIMGISMPICFFLSFSGYTAFSYTAYLAILIRILYIYIIIKSLFNILLFTNSILKKNIFFNFKNIVYFIPLFITLILAIFIILFTDLRSEYIRNIIKIELLPIFFGIISQLGYWLINYKYKLQLENKIILIVLLPINHFSIFLVRYIFGILIW